MSTLVVAFASLVGFIVAYHTYGRWLARRLFGLRKDAVVPSHELRDDIDFVPTRRSVIFGHHFTSIAGTGPIVGPALAVFWGWLPALLWVVFGSILIGGVHDMAALVISLRNRGQTIGEVAGRLISPRAKVLFLSVLALALSVVLAIFGLVIAIIFAIYPESVLSVWIAMPVAIGIGIWVYKKNGHLLIPSLMGLLILYAAVYCGAYVWPIELPANEGGFFTPVVVWTLVLLVYAFLASVLPVWLLLQPRDYINSHQLYVALALLVIGLTLASFSGQADLIASAPAIAKPENVPADAPPILPFLFITIACGACSGFHCLVSSGTTSKQIDCETDAQAVGYGAMLLEGALAVLVILACCAGVGMGPVERTTVEGVGQYSNVVAADGTALTGSAAWRTYYRTTKADGTPGGWKDHKLPQKLAAFIDGGANFLSVIGLPLKFAIAIMAVLVACFAATTLDTATRLQRYVLQELGNSLHIKPLTNRFVATGVAVGVAAAIALGVGDKPGTGGMVLWPLFGATNQLLAGLALMVAVFYLVRRSKPFAFVAIPMAIMLVMPAWAMTYDLVYNWIPDRNWTLIVFGIGILALQAWMVVEGALMWRNSQGVLEPPIRGFPAEPSS
ncbi:carbon starvation CstA family protein [Novipirellula artificiosorum]|uniref:Carbon starvation protein A n=1 Tax=Novipirellula artificiosorum TaxID=2528016 RepID=A0A5C6DMG6_9BACT|nr:carbon starvation protein A [Novipirellula artificiosorum]TWU37037.1 Carbon starvation protein A [Novipirellula artificiosorum]